MAKRRAEQVLFHNVSSKRCLTPPCGFDAHLESMAAVGGVNPPSLLALFGSRCRKRAFYFEDEEEHKDIIQPRKITGSDRHVCVSDGLLVNSPGSVQNRSSAFANSASSTTNSKKRARADKQGSPELVTHKDESGNDEGNDLSTFNSFQYWRVPLPKLDLSLLEDDDLAEPRRPTPANDLSSDAMET